MKTELLDAVESKSIKKNIPHFEIGDTVDVRCRIREGGKERIRIGLGAEQISIGDYVLSGGELAAMVIIDAVVRLLAGALGDENSAKDDSFSEGLLEYPQYTRPEVFRGMKVPDVLLSGDHAKIARWRRRQALVRTKKHRPDLLKNNNNERKEDEKSK